MHGIFFHYFKGEGHIDCQGALSQSEFHRLLDYIEKRHRIIDAESFCERVSNGCREENTVCLCFSCGLRSQYDIALPVLEQRGIKAFWMLYSNMLTGADVLIEIYHHFRFYAFSNVEEFYNSFFSYVRDHQKWTVQDWVGFISKFENSRYLSWASYYTYNDRLFKYLRDVVLGEQYDAVMAALMSLHGYVPAEHRKNLWINAQEIRELSNKSHIIGLHTHTHPNCIGGLPYDEQMREYSVNKNILESIIGKTIVSMSHPCNSYNQDTLNILRKLGVRYGFCANMSSLGQSMLEIPSEDHSNLMRKMRGET